MKLLLTLSLLLVINISSIYDFKIQALNSSEEIELSDFKGKKLLIVNVASKCGYTPQYEDLQKLSMQYNDKLVVLGMPCDQFMGQELDTEVAIKEFCTEKYSVTFPMTTVVDVKGTNQHPIYDWLTSKATNGKEDYVVKWNFNKFLIDENGKFLAYFPSKVKPMDDEILQYLK
jgi:glutathione peroxidase